MTEQAHKTDPPRPAGSGRAAEMLMIAMFAIVCAAVGGLLHLAAELPASTAALTALASMSTVLAANAIVRRKTTASLLNAQIAELRMEINGLRSARAAAPLSRPQGSYGGPAAPRSRSASDELPRMSRQSDGGGPRGGQPISPPRVRAAVPPPAGALQTPTAPTPRAGPQQPATDAGPSAPTAGPPAPEGRSPDASASGARSDQTDLKPGATHVPPPPPPPTPARIDWTLRPGVHREPTIQLSRETTVAASPGATGPLPLMPGQAARGRPGAVSAERAGPPAPDRRQAAPVSTATEGGQGDRRGPIPAGRDLTNAASAERQAEPAPAEPTAVPSSPRQPAAEAADRHASVQSPGRAPLASPMDLPATPPSDGAPHVMARPGSSAWPRVVPHSPTAPLDLDTMQNLIEQLAGQLDQPERAPADEVAQAAPAPSHERAVLSPASAGAARAVGDGSAVKRDPAPFGHLALIAEAVEARRMDVLLDPILGLSDRRARHFELSVRLLTENGGTMEEAQYAPFAAGTGLLGRIDAEKLTRAADVLQRLRARGSAASLFSTVAGESLSDKTFASTFADVLKAEEGNTSRLVLTFEQAEARNFTDAHWRVISDMSRIGMKFAMAGVTDLDMDFEILKRHGFDFIKLDARVFLEGLPTPTGTVPAADICRHLAGMGLGLIVGGIVEEKDLARILGFGVLLGQGALFGGPRSVELERERRAA